MLMSKNFNERVYEACKKIPEGRVSTYGEIAKYLNTGAYRAVGNALRENPFAPVVPCHRVVKSDGSIGGFNGKTSGMEIEKKTGILKKEGVIIKNNKVVDFNVKLYKFQEGNL